MPEKRDNVVESLTMKLQNGNYRHDAAAPVRRRVRAAVFGISEEVCDGNCPLCPSAMSDTVALGPL